MKADIMPNFVSIPEWCLRSGISRSRTYELLATGDIKPDLDSKSRNNPLSKL